MHHYQQTLYPSKFLLRPETKRRSSKLILNFRIGLAPRKDGTEMSVYLSPSFFSRPNWEVTEDDYMSKCRVDLATL